MSRPSYSVLTAGVIFTVSLLTQVVQGGSQAPPQSARPAAASASSITPEQAAPFVGNWLVKLSMGGNDFPLTVVVTADAGKVAATVSSGMQPTTSVGEISLAGKNLVL